MKSIRTCLECAAYSASTRYRGGNFDAYFAYTMTFGSQPVDMSVSYLSMTGVAAIHQPRNKRSFG